MSKNEELARLAAHRDVLIERRDEWMHRAVAAEQKRDDERAHMQSLAKWAGVPESTPSVEIASEVSTRIEALEAELAYERAGAEGTLAASMRDPGRTELMDPIESYRITPNLFGADRWQAEITGQRSRFARRAYSREAAERKISRDENSIYDKGTLRFMQTVGLPLTMPIRRAHDRLAERLDERRRLARARAARLRREGV